MNIRSLFLWLPAVVVPGIGWWFLRDAEGWILMWGLSVAIFFGSKWLSWFARSLPEAPCWKRVAYWLAWPGLDARGFLTGKADTQGWSRWCVAGGVAVIGVGFILAAALGDEVPDLARVWSGMLGIILFLHFGTMALIACFWNTVGVRARSLMNAPLLAVTLSEFWSERWNTAFRDLSSLVIFRPLARRLGAGRAAFAVFLFSGLVHDAVISIPARGGYGLPTLYFLIQWVAIVVQRSGTGLRWGLDRGLRARVFTSLVLILPLGLLFHTDFALGVILPSLQTLGGLFHS